MGTDPPENPEAQRPSPAPTTAKPDGDAASETSSAQSSEPSDRKDAESLVLSTRSEEYRFLFRLSPDDVLLQDFNCAIHENILLQGHMYLFTHHICFYSNIFGFETKKIIPFHEVTCVRKAKTVAIFHNAIEILAGVKRVTKLWYFFGSFLTRDEAYRLIVDVWVQHGGDVRAQDTKLEASSQDDAIIIFDKVKGGKALLDDSSSSNRSKDAKLSEEFKSIPNGKVDSDISIRLLEIQENEGEENVNKSLSQNPFSWTIEDIDAPKVPEHFAIVAESKFPLLVEDFFSLFVSDRAADFLKDFHARCGDKEFQCTSWHRHEQFGYTRNVSFLHPVKVYLGAKFGNCQEVQKFHVYRNSHLVIETSQQIDNVPYGDYFQVEGIWDVEQASKGENSCTVKVYSNVAFSKKTMFKAGLAEQDASMVHENNSELGSPPKLEGSTQNSTLNSTYLSRNIHEITNCNSGIDNHMKEKSQLFSPLMSIFREPWATFCSHMKAQSLLATILAVAFIIFILMQLSIILLLARVPEVHLVTHGNYNMENVEWLEKRFNYLKEEMLMVESRLERMRNEYALLKSYLQSLEQLRAKS
ncbi:protein VASCULAR ASSOCIATED DEATH 1, chloroplastic isoform X5 [Musa acuminata AAA Group]|uniref:protein VASCULAR ASSOCIATED DEATH 1, chloroplastic isoform X5 n=1 Tax=Musa acuminata AAA Group TaxID=214697 RepID=UPI0031D21E17